MTQTMDLNTMELHSLNEFEIKEIEGGSWIDSAISLAMGLLAFTGRYVYE
jgi:hypothetical protein